MKKLLFIPILFFCLSVKAQSGPVYFVRYAMFMDSVGVQHISQYSIKKVAITGSFTDLINVPSVLSNYGSGTSLQYIKGDGTYALFPTLVSSFTNDVPYLASTSTVNELSKTANYTILSTDFVAGKQPILDLSVDATAGNVTITMPTASSFSGYTIYVTKTDASANTVTISGLTGSNILYLQLQSKQGISNATAWNNH